MMSSAERAATLLTQLEPEDFRVLTAIELGMSSHRYVPVEEIERISGLNPRELEYRIRRLNNMELIYGRQQPYVGYILNYAGYDALALNALVKADILEALGKPLGVG
ncbi:MAG TPA: serine/threonine protein kinase, partial [Candidatus Bathyarchaeota archaeon]|nr:serine/threonine protein kinase [Candidatus Bathyarchaeota archaeon]